MMKVDIRDDYSMVSHGEMIPPVYENLVGLLDDAFLVTAPRRNRSLCRSIVLGGSVQVSVATF